MGKKLFICLGVVCAFFALIKQVQAFSDVSKNHPYFKAIQFLEKNNVIQGYADGSFLPGKVINRAEFLKIAIEIVSKQNEYQEDKKNKTKKQNCFQDVADEWFAEFICYAKQQNWVKGYLDGTFRPSNTITFGEAYAILGRIYNLKIDSFNAQNWYYPYQRYFEVFNLVGNIEQSIFFQVNRGEMANLVYNLQQHLHDQKTDKINQIIEEGKKLEEYKISIFNLVNQERIQEGRGVLLYNMQLEKTAQAQAEDMKKRNFFAHTNPDGEDILIRVKEFKYDQRNVGENIAAGQETPDEVMEGWLNSPYHRENILNPNFTEMGVGIYEDDPKGGYYWVQVFGKPCEERDNVVGCISRSEYQERNPEEWDSPYKWYD